MLDQALACQWVEEKNLPLTPEQLSPFSHRMVWWRCEKGHEWRASVKSRTCGCGCPVCANRTVEPGQNDLASTHPDIAVEWHPSLNGDLTPQKVVAGSHRRVWWRCAAGHEWQAAVYSRTVCETGCPVCTGKRVLAGVNDLGSMFPEIAAQWSRKRNGELTPEMVSASSNRRVWWHCEMGHEWSAVIASRTRLGTGCPYCTGRKAMAGFNDLASRFPKLAEQWDYELNGSLKPDEVTTGCSRRIWWRCAEGHIWRAAVYSRTGRQKCGCPICAGVAKKIPAQALCEMR